MSIDVKANENSKQPERKGLLVSELRMGNWVQVSGSQKPFIWTLERFWEYYTAPDKSYYYEPIPLSEDVLIKCGFVKDACDTYDNGSCIMYFLKDLTPVIEVSGGEVHPPCKYVHQLQNLYFALTNSELEINL